MEDLQCRIIISNYQLFCFRKVRKKKTHTFLYQQETWSTPYSERFTNTPTQLSTSKHIISLFRRTPSMNYSWAPISDAYCVWWQSLRLFSPRKAQALCSLCAIQGPAVCSRLTRAVQAAPAASAVETAVCPQSVMAEMFGRLPPNSMPTPTHTHSPAMHHAHTTTEGMLRSPTISGPKWAMHHSWE